MPTPRFNAVSRGMHVRQPWDPAPRTPQSIFAPFSGEIGIYSYEPRKRSERLFSVLREKVTYCDIFSAQQGVLSRTEGFPLRSIS